MQNLNNLTDEQFAQRLAAKLVQLSNATNYLRQRGRGGNLAATDLLTTLTHIERAHHEIETLLGCRRDGHCGGDHRLCEHVPKWLQRCCPWKACQLGSRGRERAAASARVGHADRSYTRTSTYSGT